jgi:CRISPR-associated protein Csm1
MTNNTHQEKDLLTATTRIALAAFLHDMGKLAERARIEIPVEKLEINKQLYCPHRKKFVDDKGFFSHVHAAYTAVALDELEKYFPDLKGDDMYPFASWKSHDADESLINAAAKHHKPETCLQWIIATADRVASGFERDEFEEYNVAEEGTSTGKSHYTARQLTLFEQINISDEKHKTKKNDIHWRYPLKALSVKSIFPVKASNYEHNDKIKAQNEYRQLWDKFIEELPKIPTSHQNNLSLWLDHFETLWGVFTQAIPSATAFNVKPEVSLYDHSRTTASIATSLWRYHEEMESINEQTKQSMQSREDWDTEKLLLIQGDCYGIQDFIFSHGGESKKQAAKLLRGRSFYVSLMTECAALKILDELNLPSTSQVINAAGKFLIVAPNTKATIDVIAKVQLEIDQWFLKHTWGQSGIGIVSQPASCNDFIKRKGQAISPFNVLMAKLFAQLDKAKYQRLQLCDHQQTIFNDFLDNFDNEKGVCQCDGISPAQVNISRPGETPVYVSQLAKDQIEIGSRMTKYKRILVTRHSLHHQTLETPIFGYHISFTKDEEITGKFGELARTGELLRAWDFSLPENETEILWQGYARRSINAYMPKFDDVSLTESMSEKYNEVEEDVNLGEFKTLNHIACEDKVFNENSQWQGISGLTTLKGDVDNLGLIFHHGLEDQNFAKMAGLSRQLNSFFTIYLPWLCQSDNAYKNTYTVFAGGDDFFLIGPWFSQIKLAVKLKEAFTNFVAQNTDIHFSVGLSTTKPGIPIPAIAEMAENSLEDAKQHNPEKLENSPKNAVTCFGQTMFWDDFEILINKAERLNDIRDELGLSTGYVYGLLQLVDMAENVDKKPEDSIWHSYFSYRTYRMLQRNKKLTEQQRKTRHSELADEIASKGIELHKANYRVALFSHLYHRR